MCDMSTFTYHDCWWRKVAQASALSCSGCYRHSSHVSHIEFMRHCRLAYMPSFLGRERKNLRRLGGVLVCVCVCVCTARQRQTPRAKRAFCWAKFRPFINAASQRHTSSGNKKRVGERGASDNGRRRRPSLFPLFPSLEKF